MRVQHFTNTPGIGKMFGVLVVKNREGNLGFLAAFSDKMGSSNHYEGFVPPVFDVLDPEGFYKEGEAKTNVVNREIEKIQVLEAYKDAVQKLQSTQVEAENFMRALKEWNNTEKAKRKEIRAQSQHLPKAEYELLCADLEKRSIYQHYKLKESATQWKAIIEKAEEELNEFKFEIDKLKIKRTVPGALTLSHAGADVPEFRASAPAREALLGAVDAALEQRGFFRGDPRRREAFAPRLRELADKMDVSERDVALLRELLEVLMR